MSRRHTIMGLVIGTIAALAFTPVAFGDTCCANTSVALRPALAMPGDAVEVDGIRCLEYDNTGPLALNLKAFWLSTDRVPADGDPGSVPGGPSRLATDLPPVERWLPFTSVSGAGAVGAGTATIAVPKLPSGSYQLWWLCDNGGGPGSGIHYSGGPRLVVGPGSPDTATATAPGREDDRDPAGLLAIAFVAGAGIAAFAMAWQRARPRTQGS